MSNLFFFEAQVFRGLTVEVSRFFLKQGVRVFGAY